MYFRMGKITFAKSYTLSTKYIYKNKTKHKDNFKTNKATKLNYDWLIVINGVPQGFMFGPLFLVLIVLMQNDPKLLWRIWNFTLL